MGSDFVRKKKKKKKKNIIFYQEMRTAVSYNIYQQLHIKASIILFADFVFYTRRQGNALS